jgi:hypothetical protein
MSRELKFGATILLCDMSRKQYLDGCDRTREMKDNGRRSLNFIISA